MPLSTSQCGDCKPSSDINHQKVPSQLKAQAPGQLKAQAPSQLKAQGSIAEETHLAHCTLPLPPEVEAGGLAAFPDRDADEFQVGDGRHVFGGEPRQLLPLLLLGGVQLLWVGRHVAHQQPHLPMQQLQSRHVPRHRHRHISRYGQGQCAHYHRVPLNRQKIRLSHVPRHRCRHTPR